MAERWVGFELAESGTARERARTLKRHGRTVVKWWCPRCRHAEVGWLVRGPAGDVFFAFEPGADWGPWPSRWPDLDRPAMGEPVLNRDEGYLLHRHLRALRPDDVNGRPIPRVLAPDERLTVGCGTGDGAHRVTVTGAAVLDVLAVLDKSGEPAKPLRRPAVLDADDPPTTPEVR